MKMIFLYFYFKIYRNYTLIIIGFKIKQLLKIKLMTNLKTDDILGARPRIRHAPRSLIRQQKLSMQYDDYAPQIPYNESINYRNQYQHQYPYNNAYENLNSSPRNQSNSRMQLQGQDYPRENNNYQGGKPRYSQNLDMSRSYMGKLQGYAGKTSDRIHQNNNVIDRYDEQIKNRASQRLFIKPKDAPVVNYNQYQKMSDEHRNKVATTYTRAYNNVNKDLYDRYHYSPKGNKIQSVELNKSKQFSSHDMRNYDDQRIKNVRSSSLDSSQVQKPKQEHKIQPRVQNRVQNAQEAKKNRNIFRGLGFNIITNTKFQYGMENRYLNNTSKWLQ